MKAPERALGGSGAGALTAWPGKSAICLPPSVSSAARAASRALYLMKPNLHGGDSESAEALSVHTKDATACHASCRLTCWQDRVGKIG